MKKASWNKSFVKIIKDEVAYYSVVFTWDLPEVRQDILQGDLNVKKSIVGGPAVYLMPDYLSDIAEVKTECDIDFLSFHNPQATFTTRGCPNRCKFCAVPVSEGNLVELKEWEVKPIISDNNLIASSRKHFDSVINKLKSKSFPWIDFNGGFEAGRFTKHHASRISELKKANIRFACDRQSQKSVVADAVKLARSEGLRNFNVYVLFGFEDTPEETLDRLNFVHKELKIRPSPMRYQSLDCLEYDSFLPEHWTQEQLLTYRKYWSSLRFFEHIPFKDFNRKQRYTVPKSQKKLL